MSATTLDLVPRPTTFALLRDAQAAIGCVLLGPDDSAIRTSSALPLIRLAAAHDGQR